MATIITDENCPRYVDFLRDACLWQGFYKLNCERVRQLGQAEQTLAALTHFPHLERYGSTYARAGILADKAGVSLATYKRHLRELSAPNLGLVKLCGRHRNPELGKYGCRTQLLELQRDAAERLTRQKAFYLTLPAWVLWESWKWAERVVFAFVLTKNLLGEYGDSLAAIARRTGLTERSVSTAAKGLGERHQIQRESGGLIVTAGLTLEQLHVTLAGG